ncbi:MAG: S9 family peptidase [Bacteroidia bacterium]
MNKHISIVTIILFLIVASLTAQKKDITLDDIFNKGIFKSKSVGYTSMKNGVQYIETEDDSVNKTQDLVLYDYKTGKKVKTFLRGVDVKLNDKPLDWEDFELSDDETKVLFSNETEQIYRHSSRSNNYVYDIVAKKLYDLSVTGKSQLCSLSPDGSKVAYVRDNNLYYWPLGANNEHMLTQDGLKNNVINGAPDWVYEEEFSFSKAYEWSPDGKKIAWMRFDESKVKEFTLTYYDSLYPRQESYKYPKAGETNSDVQVYIQNLEQGEAVKADVGIVTDQYIPRIQWADANQLSIMRLNRLQNKVDLLLCNIATGATKILFTEEDKTFIDIENSAQPKFLKDGKHFIWMSYKDGYNNIYLYTMDGKLEKQITTDKKDVLELYGYDETKKIFYYQSYESRPIDKQVYAMTLDGKKKLLGHADGTNNAEFSSGYKFFTNSYSTANTVTVNELYSADGKLIKVLEDNKALKDRIAEYKISTKEFLTIKNSTGVEMQAWMIKPLDFNPSKKYPVLMYVYGGPGAPTVNNSNTSSRDMWYQMLAQKGYIIVSVDNRGTTKQGYDFLRCTYMQQGKLESNDQVEAAKWLAKQPYIDAARIGIWGWSYGGFMTSLCMEKGADVFKMGMAVAPVTNWRFYDTIYTERYLRTPQENGSGYDDNSPINFTDKIKGKFLLVHGVADDNVHFQNSMMFVNKLIKSNVQFSTMNYPNRAHNLSGGGATMHLYTMLTDFVLNNL